MLLRRGVVSKAAALGFLATASSGRAEDLPPSLLVGALGPAIVAQTEPTLSEPGELARPPPPRNHWLPALEIVGWSLVQNRWSYDAGDREVYDVGPSSWGHKLRNWWWDRDSFTTNEFAHPYMGNVYFSMARSAMPARNSGSSAGLWGLYFNYDYISPAVYRASSSNLGFGTTAQVDWGSWAFQGHGLLGAGFGAGGSSVALGARDYHFGGQAVAQLEVTFFYRERLRFRTTSRGYFTSGKLTDQHRASEDIEYSILSVDCRIAGRNAIGLESIGARRRATYPGAPYADYRVSSLVILYELLGDAGMGRGR